MESSSSGKARGATLIDSWGRQVAGSGGSVVAAGQSVSPTREPRRVRDRQKDGARRSGTAATDHPDAAPPSAAPHPHLVLQAIDPETGHVFWQADLPGDDRPAPYPPAASSADDAAPPLAGRIGTRAYVSHQDPETEGPHVTKTA